MTQICSVVLSSLTYQARVGTAAYAEELVIFAGSSHSACTLDIVDRAGSICWTPLSLALGSVLSPLQRWEMTLKTPLIV